MADVQAEICGSLTAEIKDIKSNVNSVPSTGSSASINCVPPALNVKGTREKREEREEIEDFKQRQVRKQHTINENLLRRCIENVPLELAPKTIPQQPYEMPTTSTATFSLFNAELSSIPPPFTNQLPLTQTDAAYFVYHDDSMDENNYKMTSGELMHMLRSMAVDYCKANNIESLVDFESMDNASRLVLAELFRAVLSFHQANEADQRESMPALLSSQMSSAYQTNIYSGRREAAQESLYKLQNMKYNSDDKSNNDCGACGDQCRPTSSVDQQHSSILIPSRKPVGRLNAKYKTKLCNKFSTMGHCPYGERCQFIHAMPCYMTVEDSTEDNTLQTDQKIDESICDVGQNSLIFGASGDEEISTSHSSERLLPTFFDAPNPTPTEKSVWPYSLFDGGITNSF